MFKCSMFQVSPGMTNPGITICPHSKTGILSKAIILSLYAGYPQINSLQEKQTGEAYLRVANLMKNIKRIYQELSHVPVSKTNKTSKTLTQLNKWRHNKEILLDGALLPAFINYWRYLKRIPTIPGDTIFMCQIQNIRCSRQSVINNISLVSMSGGISTCFKLDLTLGGLLNPATTQGITNGLTLIILDGASVVDKVINKTFAHPIPFFNDILSPSSGLSGLRLIVHRNDTIASPFYQGIDIPHGAAVSVGLTAKKIKHLPEPYTECGETKLYGLLLNEIKRKVGKVPIIPELEKDKGAYSQKKCRYDLWGANPKSKGSGAVFEGNVWKAGALLTTSVFLLSLSI